MHDRLTSHRQEAPALETLEPRLFLAGDVVISEFMANNTHTLKDQDGNYSDWIELYNPGATAVNLQGWHLTDNPDKLTEWQFPAVTLQPNAYLVVFASGKDRAMAGSELHTNFSLKASGEYLALVKPDGTTIASQYAPEFPPQVADVSYGLQTDTMTTTLLGAGASGRATVPTGTIAGWNTQGFVDTSWTPVTTGVGFDRSTLPVAPGTANYYYGPYGPGGSWHLYEVVTTSRTWINAYLDAQTRTQGGVTGHLATISSAGENAFVKSLFSSGGAWIGLSDNSARFGSLGAQEYGNTGGWTVPTSGVPPSSSQRGAGFVWVTGEPFIYQNWRNTSPKQPDNLAPGEDGVEIRISDGTWRDQKIGEGTQASGAPTEGYVVEYDLNLGNWSVLEAHGGTLNNITDAINLLAGGGTRCSAAVLNYTDPQNGSTGHFVNEAPFYGNTSADDDNFALMATGHINVPSTGTYTFDVNSDDGFRLIIDGAQFTAVYGYAGTTINGDTMEFAGGRGASDSLGVTDLTAGPHKVTLYYYEGGGQSSLEFSAASGAKTAWDSTFKLVGDTASGALPVADIKDLVATDIGAAMYGVNASAYIRIPFTVSNLADLGSLNLRMKYDDGFVAYINGVEVADDNAPTHAADEPLSPTAAATAENPDYEALGYKDFDVSDALGVMVSGTNVLAIQALNASASNPDLLIVPELTGVGVPQQTSQMRYFLTPTPRARNGTGASDLGPVVSQVSVPALQPTDAQDIVVTASILAGSSPIQAGSPTLHYRVMYSTEVTLPMYDDGTNGDVTASDGIYTAVIPNAASSPGQMVRWYVTAQDTLARTGRWPLHSFVDPSKANTGSPEYVGTVVVDTVTSQLPVFRWFIDPAQLASADQKTPGAPASVFYNGRLYDNVWVHNRGGSSAGWPKHHYRFVFNQGDFFEYSPDEPAVDGFNLVSTYSDKSYMRTVLAYQVYNLAGSPYCNAFPMRVQQNGAFYSVAFFAETVDKDYLRRQGMYDDGARYKLATDVSGPNFSAAPFEKLNPDNTDRTDLQAVVTALNYALTLTGTARTQYLAQYMFDNFDVPEMVTSWAANTIMHDNDDAQKNYYLYRDTRDPVSNPNGTNLWRMLPYDKDLTFGRNYDPSAGGVLSDSIWAAHDPQSHPLFGNSEHPKIDNANAWNTIIDALLDVPQIRDMYLRRLRTVMDLVLQPPGTPTSQLYLETYINQLYNQMAPDVALDRAKWGNPYGQDQDFLTAVNILRNQYLAPRRTHLYIDHSVNTSYPDYAGIPDFQADHPVINFGAYEYNPAPAAVDTNLYDLQDAEYLTLVNPNNYAVDISGWRLRGAVDHTFDAGTVIPAGGTLYVSPNENAFRARTAGPRGGQGLFVEGNYNGHLSARGDALRLEQPDNTTVATLTTPSTSSDVQQYLRVTEIMYHPTDPSAAPPESDHLNDDFEYLELTNISPSATLSLTNVRFTDGVQFTFPAGRTLGPGERVLVVSSTDAFQDRYGAGLNGLIAGQWAGALNNGGDELRLVDAQGEVVQDFSYNNSWYTQTDGQGYSLVIRNAAAADLQSWGTREAWSASRNADGGPGAADPVDFAADSIVVNELLAHTNTNPLGDWVELKNLTGAAIDVGGWYLSDSAAEPMRFQIPADVPAETTIQPGGYLVISQYQDPAHPQRPYFGTSVTYGESGGTVYLTSGSGGAMTGYQTSQKFVCSDRDVTFGRYIKSTGGKDFVYLSAATPGADNAPPVIGSGSATVNDKVVISEIMYHPTAGGDEYVELHNTTASDIRLYEQAKSANVWMFTDGITYSFPSTGYVPAGGYALVVGIDPAAFRTKYGIPAGVPIYGPWTGSLDNAGETVELARPEYADTDPVTPYYRIDRVTYGDAAPWPEWADGQGSSLIRLSDAAYGNDPANWGAGEFGGTPGAANVAVDATPPTVPTNLAAALVSTSQINLNWTPASDPQTGIALYQVYRNGAMIATSTGASFSDTLVGAGWEYIYQVSAVNGDRLESGQSSPVQMAIVTVTSASAAASTLVKATFSEPVTPATAENPLNYRISYGSNQQMPITSAVLQGDDRTVVLTLGSPLAAGTTYTLTASNIVTQTGLAVLSSVQPQFTYTASTAGTLVREYWNGVNGNNVSDLTGNPNYPLNPTGRAPLAGLDTGQSLGDNYGDRIRGYITAPETGNYTFWVSSDDGSDFYLSTSENPAGAPRVAYVSAWTNYDAWTTETNQSSANVVGTIPLTAGQRYYFDVRHKEGTGGDHVRVQWQTPSSGGRVPIPAAQLSPYVETTVSVAATAPNASEAGPTKGTFTITRVGNTAGALTVPYLVGGTAASTDYQEALGGTATILAGQSSVTIDVTPVDDSLTEGDETVVLYLDTSAFAYAVGTSSATVAIADKSYPSVIGVALDGRADRGPSTIDPGGSMRTIQVRFSEAMTFGSGAGDVLVQTVTFPGGIEQTGQTIVPAGVSGSGTDTMTIMLPPGAAADTWVKVTISGGGTVRDAATGGHVLDGEARTAGHGYIRDAADLPTGNGTAGGAAVFYVGNLRGDYNGDNQVTSADLAGFAAAFQAGGPDADFRGVGFGAGGPDGQVTVEDLDGFAAAYQKALATPNWGLDDLPILGGAPAGGVTELPVLAPAAPDGSATAGVDVLAAARPCGTAAPGCARLFTPGGGGATKVLVESAPGLLFTPGGGGATMLADVPAWEGSLTPADAPVLTVKRGRVSHVHDAAGLRPRPHAAVRGESSAGGVGQGVSGSPHHDRLRRHGP